MKRYELELENIKKRDLYRQTITINPISASQGYINEKKCIMLASNNYLGLTHVPAVKKAAAEAVMHFGTGAGGARLINGSHPLYEQLEERLSAFKRTERAVVFSTGYMANVGTISALAALGDVIFSDQLNHASIIDGCRLSKAHTVVYKHADMDHLAKCLEEVPCQGQRFIVTDGVFSMDGDIAPLREIVVLAKKYKALIMVDDAHAVGVLGEGGRGTAAYFGVEKDVAVHMGTLSKSLASEGGYVAGSQELVHYLTNTARSFIFTTALAPATVAAAAAALNELERRPYLIDRLRQNACFMRSALRSRGIEVEENNTPIIPIVIGDVEKTVGIARVLQEQGVFVSAIRPPTVPAGSSRLRLTVSAAHEQEDLDKAAELISEVVGKFSER